MVREESFRVQSSWADKPFCYRAPYPEGALTPYEFQLAGAEYCLARKHALIGDEPGLGKTCQTILISNAIEAKSTLVICPASLRLNWEREIWKWSTIENVQTYPVLKSKDGVHLKSNYLIISYDLLRNPSLLSALLSKTWDHLILDEAHLLKDPKGNKRTKTICAEDGLRNVVGRMTLATGTILPNQPIECYNAIRLLDWDAIDRMSIESFRRHYYAEGGGWIRGPHKVKDKKTKEWVTVNEVRWSEHVRNVPQNLGELQERLRTNIMVRRLTKEVLKELPSSRWHMFPLITNTAIKKALKHPGWGDAEKMYQMDPNGFSGAIPIEGAVSTARRLLGEAKALSIVAYVKDLMNSGVQKLVIGAWHHSVLDILRQNLVQFGLTYMDGRTSPINKQLAVDNFQQDNEISIILGQMLPLGEGWNLHSAQDVVLAEPDWVPGKNEQLLRRILRIGQKGRSLIGHVPLIPDTLEEKIVRRAIEKDITIYKTLDERER